MNNEFGIPDDLLASIRAMGAAEEKEFLARKKNGLLTIAQQEYENEIDSLIGDSDGSDLSSEESSIVFNSKLSVEERAVRLAAVRASKQVKPRTFRQRITKADRIRARGMGIKLD